MTRLSTLQRITAGALLLGLCACGSGDDPAPGSTGAPAGAESQSAGSPSEGSQPDGSQPEGSASADEPAGAGTGSGTGADVSQELCAFLKKEVPRLEARGSAVGALAGFAGDYASWVEKDANRTLANAQELDKITTARCPQVREDILAVLETPSFSSVLGS